MQTFSPGASSVSLGPSPHPHAGSSLQVASLVTSLQFTVCPFTPPRKSNSANASRESFMSVYDERGQSFIIIPRSGKRHRRWRGFTDVVIGITTGCSHGFVRFFVGKILVLTKKTCGNTWNRRCIRHMFLFHLY